MVTADHFKDVKKVGMCAYVKDSLPVRKFSNSYLSKCLTLEVAITNRWLLLTITNKVASDMFIQSSQKQYYKSCDEFQQNN